MSKLNGLNPRYWYIDEDGNIAKYLYCKLCLAGPFKESDNLLSFTYFGMGKKDPYCSACADAHHNFTPLPPSSKMMGDLKREPLIAKSPFINF